MTIRALSILVFAHGPTFVEPYQLEGIVLRNAQTFRLCSIPRSCNKLSGRRRFEAPSSLHHYSSSLPHSSLDPEIPSKHTGQGS